MHTCTNPSLKLILYQIPQSLGLISRNLVNVLFQVFVSGRGKGGFGS